MIEKILADLRAGQNISRQDVQAVLTDITEDKITPAQTGAFLTELALKGETSEEILGAVRFLKDKVEPISAPENAIDCCGTGGDGLGTYNISTATAFVLAACGIPVAKHGNRAASSKSGAADVLEAMGVQLALSKEACEEALRKFNFCFLMAPHHHKVLKPLASLRRELGFRTIFNLLGPLANPADTKRQLIGVYDRKLLLIFAQTLREMGTEKAMIVHGEDGLDEITLTGRTFCVILDKGEITDMTLTPADFGLNPVNTADILGGSGEDNARAMSALLEGSRSAYRDMVLANAAGALWLTGIAPDLKDGVAMAAKALDDGKALEIFSAYRDFTNRK